jgi:hypothetical protein
VRKRDWRKEVSRWADALVLHCPPFGFPQDLCKIAAKRDVQRIRFRRMPVDGALEVNPSGFEIQIRANKEQTVPVSEVDSSMLSVRQRFSFAHEISHTFFYNSELRLSRPQPRKALLEALCNYGAACILMPEFLVERHIGVGGRLTSVEMALNLAEVARVSPTVAVRRLDEFEFLKAEDYALIALEPNLEGALLTTSICLSGVFLAFSRPKLHVEPPVWVKDVAPGAFAGIRSVCRVSRDHQWVYVSRAVSNPKRPSQLLVEIRLDLKSFG